EAVQLGGRLCGPRWQARDRRRLHDGQRRPRPGREDDPRQPQVARRHPQLLHPESPLQAGRRPGPRDPHLVQGDEARQVRDPVRRALRVRPLRHARVALRPLAGRVRRLGPRESRGSRELRKRTMSEAISHAHARHDAVHHEAGFLRTYVFSTDHKMIGKQFLTLGLFGLMMGGILALLVRWELAWPETPVPGMGWVPEPRMYGGVIPPETYNAFFTMHATLMIFFAVMPILVGCFGNFLIPLMIGARDMAFPLLNMLSFWVGAVAAVIMFSSFFVTGGP